jgi:hypothetical protein
VSSTENEIETGAGAVTGFESGTVSGVLTVWSDHAHLDAVTVEVYAHGILATSGRVPVGGKAPGDSVPFRLPFKRFPKVSLPCELRAQVIETGAVLDSTVVVETLDALWEALVPFRARVGRVTRGQILVEVTGEVLYPDAEVFELRESGDLLEISTPAGRDAGGNTLFAIPLPEALLDGNEHKLFVSHRGSNLPVNVDPVSVTLNLALEPQPTVSELIGRVDAVERRVRESYAEAFNGLALGLYRHIDAVLLKQRSNFEREIATLRRMLGQEDADAETRAALADRVVLPFFDELTGYGIGDVQQSNTGKRYRSATDRFGLLLPPVVPAPARLVIQGLRRAHDTVLDGAELFLNGAPVDASVYVSERSESWNVTADLPAKVLRQDRNLVEIRLPNAAQPGTLTPPEACVGILELSLVSQTDETDPETA